MIQDIAPHKLNNHYEPGRVPGADSPVVCFFWSDVLVRTQADIEDDLSFLPTYGELPKGTDVHFLFDYDGAPVFATWYDEEPEIKGFELFTIKDLRNLVLLEKHQVFLLMTALQLANWYRDNRFCGRCATPTEHDSDERALVCPQCGRRIYPRILPAVIVAVTWQNESQDCSKILLTKYSPKTGHAFPYYALVAGFTEIGETLEGTVRREVFEETSLRVKNIRYYKSQPWSVVDDLLMGFFCEADTDAMQAENAAQNPSEAILDANGDPVIHLDENELRTGVWLTPEEMTLQPDAYSLTNEMMLLFKAGRIHSHDDLPLALTRADIEELEQQFYGNRGFDRPVKL
ncbi:MAG: NUDIX domain-containing protein, partial [Clostridia bacterium]|nr:NUDIX domain-containing protein [Clostridia bacterium]